MPCWKCLDTGLHVSTNLTTWARKLDQNHRSQANSRRAHTHGLTIHGLLLSATLFTFVAQLLGVGNVAPIYYFLHITFAPSAAALGRSADDRRLRPELVAHLLPLFLALHTFEVARALTAPGLETRQYWAWAWQMTPLWIGVANSLLSSSNMIASATWRRSVLASPRSLLVVMCAISSSFWIYTLSSTPYSLSDIFIPDSADQADFIGHTRKAFQSDEVYSFGSSFLWIMYMFYDLHAAGLVGLGSLVASAFLPLVAAVTGPGTAFAIGWYWREQVLSSHK